MAVKREQVIEPQKLGPFIIAHIVARLFCFGRIPVPTATFI
jgi:hypothetical protein